VGAVGVSQLPANVQVLLIAAGLAAGVGVIGLVLAQLTRRSSLRWSFVIVALSAVVGVIAGIVGTARAMFLSQHDFAVTLWVVGAAGLVSLGFALAVARMAVRDSRAVEEATKRLGERGSFVPPEGMSAELSALSAQLAETSRQLAEANDRERALETSRRELVAWVSHDLRTPLAGLRAMAEALEDGIAEDPQRYHQQMRETVDRMARMVDDLFELSRIHSGALELSLEQVPVEDAISEALAVIGPVARAKSVRLDGFAEPGVTVQADPRELARMIGNLVTNAIRHTPSEGLVEVTARASDKGVEFAVVDRCGGIPEADLDRVFDVAWRGSHARTPDAAAGSGLGLAIVRGIAEAHRGSVSVDNVDEGCRFLVQLPA
jgi:signal transduction histidine kinase